MKKNKKKLMLKHNNHNRKGEKESERAREKDWCVYE